MNIFSCFFITGVNGAGKSTLVPLLIKMLPRGYKVIDFDQRGVPNNVDVKWRQKTTRHWLQTARRNTQKNVHTVICGLSKPREIYAIATKKQKSNIHVAFLDVSSSQIEKRLRQRISSPLKVKNLKEVTGLTLRACIAANIQHAKELRKECKKYHCKVFNTTSATPKRTAVKVTHWILRS